jgi:transcriptional regulator with XRE-family HTH domain
LLQGWTQEVFAEKANINDKEVSHIEAGKRNITIETLVKIANAFDIELQNLIVANSKA